MDETPNFSSLSRVPGNAASELDVVNASSAGSRIAFVRRPMHGPTAMDAGPTGTDHGIPGVREGPAMKGPSRTLPRGPRAAPSPEIAANADNGATRITQPVTFSMAGTREAGAFTLGSAF